MGTPENTRDYDITNLHPLMRSPVFDMIHELRFATGRPAHLPDFGIFEGYRSPERQAYLLKRGDSKAGPWQSAHQYGLAVDIVPIVDGQWSWNVGADIWTHIASIAVRHGLVVPIGWDKAHVQHPLFAQAKRLIGAAVRTK